MPELRDRFALGRRPLSVYITSYRHEKRTMWTSVGDTASHHNRFPGPSALPLEDESSLSSCDSRSDFVQAGLDLSLR